MKETNNHMCELCGHMSKRGPVCRTGEEGPAPTDVSEISALRWHDLRILYLSMIKLARALNGLWLSLFVG
jgi:hypothetical protein